jgi:hypothetical protein
MLGSLDESEDLVQETFAPVLLGDGVRLFEKPGGTKIRLERLKLTHTPLATCIWLRVVR